MDIPGDTPWGERRKMFKHVIYEKRCAMCGKKFDATNAKNNVLQQAVQRKESKRAAKKRGYAVKDSHGST